MKELIDFLTSKEIIVVYIVAAVACLLCFIIYLIDKNYYKRKQRHNTRELNKLVEEVNEIVENEEYEDEEVEVYDTPVLSPIIEEQPVLVETEEPALTIAQLQALDTKEENIQPIVEEIQEEVVENLEFIEPINVEDIVLSSMPEEQLEVIEEQPEIIEVQPEVEIIEPEEELQYTTIEPNRQQAQEELMRLTEELEKAEQETKAIDLTAYEEEQEENAIISLEELVRKSKEMYESNEITQYADEGNEPISLEDLERRMKAAREEIVAIEANEPVVEEQPVVETLTQPTTVESLIEELEPQTVILDDLNTIQVEEQLERTLEVHQEPVKPLYQSYQSDKKFERSPVISPIYGIERKETSSELELENTANYEKLDEEIKKTNEFLMTLRELQKNLD